MDIFTGILIGLLIVGSILAIGTRFDTGPDSLLLPLVLCLMAAPILVISLLIPVYYDLEVTLYKRIWRIAMLASLVQFAMATFIIVFMVVKSFKH